MWRFLLCETIIICPKRFLSAFKTNSLLCFWFPLSLFVKLENVFRFCFFHSVVEFGFWWLFFQMPCPHRASRRQTGDHCLFWGSWGTHWIVSEYADMNLAWEFPQILSVIILHTGCWQFAELLPGEYLAGDFLLTKIENLPMLVSRKPHRAVYGALLHDYTCAQHRISTGDVSAVLRLRRGTALPCVNFHRTRIGSWIRGITRELQDHARIRRPRDNVNVKIDVKIEQTNKRLLCLSEVDLLLIWSFFLDLCASTMSR